MANATEERPLPPLAKDIKKFLRKTPQTPQQIAEKLGRPSAQGIGRALSALVDRGVAEKLDDGRYKKAETS